MHLDPHFLSFTIIFLALLLSAIIVKKFKQPYQVGYLLAGMAIAPFAIKLSGGAGMLSSFGAVGVVFLLFFIGLEISTEELVKNWKVTILGTLFQIILSIACIWIIGHFLDWPFSRVVLLGFVISLSSSAMVIRFLEDTSQTNTPIGKDVISVLISQDILVIPMMITIGLMGRGDIDGNQLFRQLVGGVFLILLIFLGPKFKNKKLKFLSSISNDKELQILFALSFAFGISMVSGYLDLSTALGAFVAGNFISNMKVVDWFHKSLDPFKVVFIAMFFASIGMMIDFNFLIEWWWVVIALALTALISNTLINAVILKLVGRTWKNSFASGALLSQIGEFSFILAALGFQAGMINEFGYKSTISTISLTIIVTPFWVKSVNILTGKITFLDRSEMR